MSGPGSRLTARSVVLSVLLGAHPAWATVAELLGHTGTAMVMQHYSKLSEKREYLRNAMEQATKKPE
jgi:integrase